MEKTYNAALIRRVQEYMEKHSISQNQLAAKVNLSSAALSSYLNQKYKGSVEAVERQLTEFFKINDEVAAVAEKVGGLLPREPYVPTSISEDVYQSIRFAQLEHCMVVLHGDAGVGKSKGAQKFLKDHPTNAVGSCWPAPCGCPNAGTRWTRCLPCGTGLTARTRSSLLMRPST